MKTVTLNNGVVMPMRRDDGGSRSDKRNPLTCPWHGRRDDTHGG